MKTLLSPLHLIPRFCKHCARSFYKENPDNWIWEHELGSMPPLGMFDPSAGFVPDLPLFLMFDEFIIDAAAVEVIESGSRPWLGQWTELVLYLRAEGVLEPVDLSQTIKEVGAMRGQMTRADMRRPARWASAMEYHGALRLAADEAFTSSRSRAKGVDWKFDSGHIPRLKGDDELYHSYSGLLANEAPDETHAELFKVALAFLRWNLSEVNAGIAASLHLGAAAMFWAPYRQYVLEKAGEAGHQGAHPLDGGASSKQFFEIAFPQFKPRTVLDIARLRKDQRLASLRDEINRATRDGDVLDPKYPQAILREVLKLDRSLGAIRRITGWVSAVAGMIPGAGLVASATGNLVAGSVEARKKRNLRWLYMISDGVGHS